jgi:hypothetical protein
MKVQRSLPLPLRFRGASPRIRGTLHLNKCPNLIEGIDFRD